LTDEPKYPKVIKLTKVCPHCGEAVNFVINKTQNEQFAQMFKTPLTKARLLAERI